MPWRVLLQVCNKYTEVSRGKSSQDGDTCTRKAASFVLRDWRIYTHGRENNWRNNIKNTSCWFARELNAERLKGGRSISNNWNDKISNDSSTELKSHGRLIWSPPPHRPHPPPPPRPNRIYTMLGSKFEKHPVFADFGRRKKPPFQPKSLILRPNKTYIF